MLLQIQGNGVWRERRGEGMRSLTGTSSLCTNFRKWIAKKREQFLESKRVRFAIRRRIKARVVYYWRAQLNSSSEQDRRLVKDGDHCYGGGMMADMHRFLCNGDFPQRKLIVWKKTRGLRQTWQWVTQNDPWPLWPTESSLTHVPCDPWPMGPGKSNIHYEF